MCAVCFRLSFSHMLVVFSLLVVRTTCFKSVFLKCSVKYFLIMVYNRYKSSWCRRVLHALWKFVVDCLPSVNCKPQNWKISQRLFNFKITAIWDVSITVTKFPFSFKHKMWKRGSIVRYLVAGLVFTLHKILFTGFLSQSACFVFRKQINRPINSESFLVADNIYLKHLPATSRSDSPDCWELTSQVFVSFLVYNSGLQFCSCRGIACFLLMERRKKKEEKTAVGIICRWEAGPNGIWNAINLDRNISM